MTAAMLSLAVVTGHMLPPIGVRLVVFLPMMDDLTGGVVTNSMVTSIAMRASVHLVSAMTVPAMDVPTAIAMIAPYSAHDNGVHSGQHCVYVNLPRKIIPITGGTNARAELNNE
jgi:hypothetical protein